MLVRRRQRCPTHSGEFMPCRVCVQKQRLIAERRGIPQPVECCPKHNCPLPCYRCTPPTPPEISKEDLRTLRYRTGVIKPIRAAWDKPSTSRKVETVLYHYCFNVESNEPQPRSCHCIVRIPFEDVSREMMNDHAVFLRDGSIAARGDKLKEMQAVILAEPPRCPHGALTVCEGKPSFICSQCRKENPRLESLDTVWKYFATTRTLKLYNSYGDKMRLGEITRKERWGTYTYGTTVLSGADKVLGAGTHADKSELAVVAQDFDQREGVDAPYYLAVLRGGSTEIHMREDTPSWIASTPQFAAFIRSLKPKQRYRAYWVLYLYYVCGQEDGTIFENSEGLAPSASALRQYRLRLLKLGNHLNIIDFTAT